MDVAASFANREVYSIVKKWARLTPVQDDKGAKKREPTAAKQKSSASPADVRKVMFVAIRIVLF